MAKTRDDWTFAPARKRVSGYPWEEWQDGRVWEVHKGEDFECDARSFTNQLSQQARKNSLSVRYDVLDRHGKLVYANDEDAVRVIFHFAEIEEDHPVKTRSKPGKRAESGKRAK